MTIFDFDTRTRRSRVAARSPALCVLVNGAPASVPVFDFTLVGRLTRGHPANDSGDQIADVHKPVVAPVRAPIASVSSPSGHAQSYPEATDMASGERGEKLPQMDSVVTEQTEARLAWWLAGVYPGASKRKRIARDFEVSPETAKGWLNGARPSARHFDAMCKRWGEEFFRFVYQPLGGRLDRIERDVAAILRGREP